MFILWTQPVEIENLTVENFHDASKKHIDLLANQASKPL